MPVGVLNLPLGSVLTGQPEVIGSSVLAAAASSIRFDFPPVYRAVLLSGWTQHTVGSYEYLRLNGDTGSNYINQNIGVSGASISGGRLTAQAQFNNDQVVSGIAGMFNPDILIIKSKAAAKAQVLQLSSTQIVATIGLSLYGGEWNNTTDLLNRVDIYPSGGNFDTNTSITLWGLRL